MTEVSKENAMTTQSSQEHCSGPEVGLSRLALVTRLIGCLSWRIFARPFVLRSSETHLWSTRVRVTFELDFEIDVVR